MDIKKALKVYELVSYGTDIDKAAQFVNSHCGSGTISIVFDGEIVTVDGRKVREIIDGVTGVLEKAAGDIKKEIEEL